MEPASDSTVTTSTKNHNRRLTENTCASTQPGERIGIELGGGAELWYCGGCGTGHSDQDMRWLVQQSNGGAVDSKSWVVDACRALWF